MNILFGVSATQGIGIGKAFVLPEEVERVIPKIKISPDKVGAEWDRFQNACQQVNDSLNESLATIDPKSLQHIIFETYLLMLTDPVFTLELKEFLEKNLYNIEYVLEQKVAEYADRLRKSGNDYLAERAQDIEEVFERVQNILIGYHPFNIEEVPDGAVIVARTLKTSDTLIMSKRKIAGLALTEGGVSSHVAILARSYGIAAVVGLQNISDQVSSGEDIIIDGNNGEVIIQPDGGILTEYAAKIAREKKYLETLKKFRDKKACTEDGTEFNLYANIGTVEEAKIALEEGADGIGLFRTEFLFMNSMREIQENSAYTNSVDEEFQFNAYKEVLQIMGDRPVTIRTLDAGGDKLIDMKDIPQMQENNPLMGLRAIRLSLYYPRIFRTQLRALYRASVYGNLRIMIPLITDVSQVETVLGIARGVRMSLKEEGIPFKEVPIGIMVETAAAAICADCFAPVSDFFSLGTNDLTQYTLGVDRENSAVSPLYNEFNLAVLRLIQNTIQAAEKEGIPISVCGEMAGRKESVIILAGLGIRSLSMTPKQIPIIKETLSQFSIDELQNLSSHSIIRG